MKIRIAFAATVAASLTAITAAHATVTHADAPHPAPIAAGEFVWE